MKKTILGLAIILSIATSCKKEDAKVCNCGLVVSDDVNNYSVVIRNSCSGHEKTFYLQPGDWMNAYVGSDYCITNETSW
jgi:hypothetical protein